MNDSKFIVDAMLGNIAKKLRLFGYDSTYSSAVDDKEIISIAQNENRIVLTRDQDLFRQSTKLKIQSVFLDSVLETNQLIQINRSLSLGKFSIDVNKARCSICNEKLALISKEAILTKIPNGVKNNRDFWLCSKCDKIYWEGTHIEKLKEFTSRLNEKL